MLPWHMLPCNDRYCLIKPSCIYPGTTHGWDYPTHSTTSHTIALLSSTASFPPVMTHSSVLPHHQDRHPVPSLHPHHLPASPTPCLALFPSLDVRPSFPRPVITFYQTLSERNPCWVGLELALQALSQALIALSRSALYPRHAARAARC